MGKCWQIGKGKKACTYQIQEFTKKIEGYDTRLIVARSSAGKDRFIKKYRPKYLIHGHIHTYGTENNWLTTKNSTKVINAYGYRIIEI